MYTKALPLAALAAYATAQDMNNSSSMDLNATLSGNSDLSNLTALLAASPELSSQLNSAQNITVLAPNNAAFAKLNMSLAADNSAALYAALIQYHVLNGSIGAEQITNMSSFVPTQLTDNMFANVTGGQRVEAVKVGNETVFYSGLLQNSTVSQSMNFSGGQIHIIDTVLAIPSNVSFTSLTLGLTSLRGALNATNLTEAIDTTPDLTIFAPNNEAFRAIGGTLANLSIEDIASVLSYHVVNGSVDYSTDLMNGTSLMTLGGKNLTITMKGMDVFVNAAKVVTPNVLVANGVVHIIDDVLNPNGTEGPKSDASSGTVGFPGATSASEDPYTSGQPTATSTVNPTSAGAGPAQTEAGGSGSKAAAMPMRTGAVGAAALFGAGAAVFVGY